jgi:hypothetical protein
MLKFIGVESHITEVYKQISPQLNERDLRLFVAAQANAVGYGGIELLHKITGIARSTIKRGQDELAIQAQLGSNEELEQIESSQQRPSPHRVRRQGGGRKEKSHHCPAWITALEKLVEPSAKGDPESALRWTIKSSRTLSKELKNLGFNVCPNTVLSQLYSIGFSLKGNYKAISKLSHPDRNAQFEFINNQCRDFLKSNNPVISVDTKKKEILGNFKNQGQQWLAKDKKIMVNDHDIPDPELPMALPYGVYDIQTNQGHVFIGTDHDTSEFAANSIYGWWFNYGNEHYKDATEILITADSGGSNGYRFHLWKYSLQNIVNKIKIPISVCHFPPGTSKWNKVEHKLFSFISINWQGEPLKNYETVVNLISSTKTAHGLTVTCVIDDSKYPTGKKVTKAEKSSINIERNNFHGEWNYKILPK